MGRARVWFAAWGLDVLVVAAAASSAIGTVARDDADRPDGPQLWFEAFAIGVVLLALCARRQLPFLAPAFVWVGCAALSVLDHQLLTSQPGDAQPTSAPLPKVAPQAITLPAWRAGRADPVATLKAE